MLSISALALLAGTAFAAPLDLDSRALKDGVQDLTIHESCNSTQRRMLQAALA